MTVTESTLELQKNMVSSHADRTIWSAKRRKCTHGAPNNGMKYTNVSSTTQAVHNNLMTRTTRADITSTTQTN